MTSSTSSSADVSGRFDVYVLGTAQDGGLPHLGCEKTCCATARSTGRIESPACLGIHDRETNRLLLIEASPAIELQISMFHRLTGGRAPSRTPIDALMITHAHIGHYTGLIQLGREVASTQNLSTYVTPRMAKFLRANGPWSQMVEEGELRLLEVSPSGEPFTPIEGLNVEAISVPHREEFSDTVGFRIHGPQRTVLFCPDVDRWAAHEGLLEKILEGVDFAFIDGTFYDGRELPGRDIAEVPHPPIIDSMERLKEKAQAQPGRIRFIHMNHNNPVFHDPQVIMEITDRGFGIAKTGDRISI